MSGTRSAQVRAKIGLDLSAKFLSALGLPVPGADVTATLWDRATAFSFEVRDVKDNQVDIAHLGRVINGLAVARNPATEIFLVSEQQLLLITRTLTATMFAVRASGGNGQAVTIDVDGIADLVGSAQAEVSWKRQHDDWISFRGAPVTFGFTYEPPKGHGIRAIPADTPLACWLPIRPGLTPHRLRHSHKTWMVEDGIPKFSPNNAWVTKCRACAAPTPTPRSECATTSRPFSRPAGKTPFEPARPSTLTHRFSCSTACSLTLANPIATSWAQPGR